MSADPAGRTAVYWLYGADGKLLYVGMTDDPDRRFVQHTYNKPWWSDVTRREIHWFPDRASAAQAEAQAIRAADPPHNGTYSPSRSRRINRDDIGPDGVRRISLSRARNDFGEVLATAQDGTTTILLNYGRPRICLVSSEFYEEAVKALGRRA